MSLAEFNRVGKSLMISSRAQDPVTSQFTRTVSIQPIDPAAAAASHHCYHTKHCVLIMITPKRHPPSACRIPCKFQPFLTPFINTTCSDIDCYVLSVLTSRLAGHTRLSVLLLGGPHRLHRRPASFDRWSRGRL